MATIQVRDVPESVYRVLHRRARAAGKSLQSYMREQIEQLAAAPTEDELFSLAREVAQEGGHAVDLTRLLADRDADRA